MIKSSSEFENLDQDQFLSIANGLKNILSSALDPQTRVNAISALEKLITLSKDSFKEKLDSALQTSQILDGIFSLIVFSETDLCLYLRETIQNPSQSTKSIIFL